MRNDYTDYYESHDIILTKYIDVCHIFFRLVFLIPIFVYHILKCLLNAIVLSITGMPCRETYAYGDLFEFEKSVFYRNVNKGTVLYQLYENINNGQSFIIKIISDTNRICVKKLNDTVIKPSWNTFIRYLRKIMYIITYYLLIQYIKIIKLLHMMFIDTSAATT
jgi:hypothetical protein